MPKRSRCFFQNDGIYMEKIRGRATPYWDSDRRRPVWQMPVTSSERDYPYNAVTRNWWKNPSPFMTMNSASGWVKRLTISSQCHQLRKCQTIEFLVDKHPQFLFYMEMNAVSRVEHCNWRSDQLRPDQEQIKIAAGRKDRIRKITSLKCTPLSAASTLKIPIMISGFTRQDHGPSPTRRSWGSGRQPCFMPVMSSSLLRLHDR